MSSNVSTDPIADMLSRMRNAIAVRKDEVSLPHSSMKEAVARILMENKFIDDVQVSGEKVSKTLTIRLNEEHGNAHITEISRLSKPGRRHYVSAQDIPTVKRGRGLVIVSTSKGLLTGDAARAQRIGGELICEVY